MKRLLHNPLKAATILVSALIVIGAILSLGCTKATDAPERNDAWLGIGESVYLKVVEIEGHRYVVTIRNGSYSYNAQTVHAASCPCGK